MDNKRLVMVMLLAMALVLGWQFFVAEMYRRHPEWKRPGQDQTAATQPAPAPATLPATLPTLVEGPGQPAITTTPSVPSAAAEIRAKSAETGIQQVVLGADAQRYNLRVELTSQGAAIASVQIPRYKARGGQETYVFQRPYSQDSATHALAMRWISVNNSPQIELANLPWNLEAQSDTSATFAVTISNAEDLLRIRRTYQVQEKNSSSTGYELSVAQSFQNLSGRQIAIKTAFNGPNVPPQELDRPPDQQLIAGYENDGQVAVVAHMIESFKPDKPVKELIRNDDDQPLLWAGAESVYFNAILRSSPLDQGAVPRHIPSVEAKALNPQAHHYHEIILQFQTSEQLIPPGASLELPLEVYLGPKLRKVLNSQHYEKYPKSYDRTLVVASGICAICTFQWLINILVWMLNAFHVVTFDWGLAIIVLVCIVRAILHPITKRSQVSMMKMGKMGPEMERLKKKYGDNKDELNKAMMELYKQQGATPILGCLPMFLQMPIWIALWSALRSTFELRQEPFLYGLTWIDDLARPDRLITWPAIKLFFGIEIDALNLLPLLMAVVFYLQYKMTPKPPPANEQQAQQQKMMQWMTLMFPVFLYNGPSGLNLYIMTSTFIGIIESKIVRDHIKKKEDEEKAGKVIVEARPTRGMKQRQDFQRAPEPRKRGIMGWLQQLQEKAEAVRREAEKNRGR